MPLSPLLLGLLAAIVPTAQAAKDAPVTSVSSTITSEELGGETRLKLWSLPGHEGLVGVRLRIGDTPYLFAVDPTLDQVQLGSAACAAAGGAVKPGETWAKVRIDTLGLGKSEVERVDAVCAAPLSLPKPPPSGAGGQDLATLASFDGVLGLASFAEMPWALAPSQGELILGGGTVSGQAIEAQPVAPDVKLKTKDTTYWLDGTPFPVTARVSSPGQPAAGAPGLTVLQARRATGAVDARSVPADAPRRARGDVDEVQVTVELGGISRTVWLEASTAPAIVAQYNGAPSLPVLVLGRDVLTGLDIGWAPSSRTLTVAEGARPERSGMKVLAQRTAEALEAAQRPAEGAADAEAVGAAALAHGRVLLASGDIAGALDALSASVAAAPESCDAWRNLGMVRRMASPSPELARTDLEKAVELYEAWWAWDTEVREKLEKSVEKAEKQEAAYAFEADGFGFVRVRDIDQRDVRFGAPQPVLPAEGTVMQTQPAACHVARTELATLDLLAGDSAAVEAHFGSLDLDPGLARLAAISRLQQGEPVAAQAAARQAIEREHSRWDARSRAVLALAKAAAGQEGRAAMDRALALSPHDLRLHQLRLSMDDDGSQRMATARAAVEARPESLAAAAVWLAESVAQGSDLAPARAAVETARAARLAAGQSTVVEDAHIALATGDTAAAAAAAAKAVSEAPLSAAARWAQAAVLDTQGDAAAAAAARTEAARRAPQHPGYALMSATLGS